MSRNIFQLPETIRTLDSVSILTPAPRVVQPATIEQSNLSYVADVKVRYDMIRATDASVTALWPCVASEFADNVTTWDNASTGTPKERARIMAKNARVAMLATLNHGLPVERQVKTLPGSTSDYLSQLARGRQCNVSPVADNDANGKPTAILGWTMFLACIKEATGGKEKETAADCLVRLVKAYETHAGSRIPSGTVTADAMLPMLAAFADSVGLLNLRGLMDRIAETQQTAQPLHVSELTAPVTDRDQLIADRKHTAELEAAAG